MLPARRKTWKRIFVGTKLSLKSMQPHFKSEEDCDAFGDRSTQCGATSEILGVVAPGSSHWSSRCEELVQTPDTISIKVEEDIGGGLPAVEDCDAFGDRSTQCGATSQILGVDAPGSSHMSSHSEELLQQTPDTISIMVEEDIGGGFPALEDVNDITDCSTQRGATSESLRLEAPGSSHMSSHSGELRILTVYGQWEGPLAVNVHNTLFAASEPEALSSLSADHSVAKSLNCSVRLVRLEELTGQQGGRKGRPGVFCGKVIPNKANMIVHMRTHNDKKPYKCDKCTKRFGDSYALKIHMRTHSGEKPYRCDQCMKCFSLKDTLNKHMRTHSGEKPYRCDQCMKCFSLKDTLNKHMRSHSGEKPYKCEQCSKRCSRRDALNIHMRTHSSEKPYKCDQCMKCFSLKDTLNIHMRTHSGEKPYKCDQCQMRFSQNNILKNHLRTHTGEKPYRCDQCPKCFSLKGSLKIHLRTHSVVKPYKCDQCTMRFSQKGTLKIHMRTRSGEKPYKCDQCTMRSSDKGTLKNHMRTHSG
ncbi:zinc finger protein 25 [Gadus morhua]|uniref:zinc finger protein 25 n=1 Tax=Gadus morhua TaxID=8049 RepID=UPI0011B4DBD9|nr:zinc finger protein 25-like [Gadus morhua]